MSGRLFALLFGWLRSRTAWVLLGLATLAILLWLVGPILALGNAMPLASVESRLIVIAALFGAFALVRAVAAWRSRSINRRLLGLLAEARDALRKEAAAPDETARLRERFDEAMAVLKSARYGPSGGGASRFLRRGQYVYELPWYLILGAPGAGKTTALAKSGLEFPLAATTGRGALRGIGGTRNCDWWFTDRAVLIDTAGRYTTHESDALADAGEWSGFLALLKKYRPRQPINGVLVAVSVSELLSMDPESRRRHAERLRARLDDLRSAVGMDFPVYCIVTKCDLLSGFAEFFAGLDRAGRSQVWGVTLPLEAGAAAESSARIADEMRLLQQRLHERLASVLYREPDVSRRALCYGLPQQFEGLTALMLELFETLARPSRYSQSPLLRGLYFTSATQEGSPFDRVLSALDATFHTTAARRARCAESGHSFFIGDLLRNVVFAEAHLAGRDRHEDSRLRRVRAAGYALAAAALAATVIACSISYRNNSGYIAEVAAKGSVLATDVAALPRSPGGGQLAMTLPLLDRSDHVSDHADFPHDAPLLPWRFGLYQGHKLRAASDVLYERLLRERLAPALNARLEELLRGMQVDDLDFAFETLRAYLMLHDRARFDAEEFRDFMLADWDRNRPDGTGASERSSYERHLAKAAGLAGVEVPPLDAGLVQDARSRLAQFSLSARVYGRLRRKLGDNLLPAFSVAASAGEHAASVFRRASGKPLTEGVPSLYTARGYHELILPELDHTFAMLGKDESWVLGHAEDPPARMLQDRMSGAFVQEVKRLYLRDYVLQWERFLDDVKLVQSDTLLDSVQLARTLGAPDSPLARFVKAVARETRLSGAAGAPGAGSGSLLERVRSSVRATRDDLGRIVGPSAMPAAMQAQDKPERLVDARFESLHRLAEGNGGNAPIDAVVQSMNELYSLLAAADAARKAGSRPPNGDLPQRLKADAGRLPQPVRRIVEELAHAGQIQLAREEREARSGELAGSVGLLCEQTIAGRYPFAAGAEREVMPEDFARMFGPNGKFDTYFRTNLDDVVNVSTRPWTLRRGAQAGMGAGASLAAFEKAATIRDVFFRSGDGVPKITLTIRPVEMDASITSFALDIDGQVLRYQHGPQIGKTVTWPGPRGSQQVRVMLEPAQPGRSSGLSSDGPWALHRLFDEAQVVAGDSPERFVATFDLGGRKVTLEAVANSVHNPFRMQELTSFRCPVAL